MYYLANFKDENNLKRNIITVGAGLTGLAGLGLGAKVLRDRVINKSANNFQTTAPKQSQHTSSSQPERPSLAERRKRNAERKGIYKRQAEMKNIADEPIKEGLRNINDLVKDVKRRRRDLIDKNYVKPLDDGNLEVTKQGKKLFGGNKPEIKQYQELYDKQSNSRGTRESLNRTQADAQTIGDRKSALIRSNEYLEKPLGIELYEAGYPSDKFTAGNYLRYKAKQKYGKYNTTNDFNLSDVNIIKF